MTRTERIGDATLILGDCREVLPTLGRVEAVVTDPPYGIGKAEWDIEFNLDWFDAAAGLTNTIAVMPGTWNLLRLPHERAGLVYKWTLSAHLVNGMTKGGFGWGNWIPLVVYRRKVPKPQPQEVQDWCRAFAEWCALHGISRGHLDSVCGTSDMGGWYLGLIPHRCQMPARRQWEKIAASFHVPDGMQPNWAARESDYEPVTDCRRFAIGGETKPDHPSPKPLNVTEWFVSVVDSATVLDPFMGSGTTGVACARLGRSFVGIEIEERYFDIACRRIEAAYRQRDLFIPAPVPVPPEDAQCLDLFREPEAAE